jgi:membrane protein DedA with SNARE-associated domain
VTDTLLALVPVWGPALMLVATFLSCLALPVPASLLMLAGGAFAAGGDLDLVATAAAALVGALLGDQAGYLLGRSGGPFLARFVRRRPGPIALMHRARAFAAARGGLGVFLSRWLFSPLGPYVNLVAGATGMGWRAFALAGALGEVVWVALYVGAGYLFADRIGDLAALSGNLSAALAAGLAAAILGAALIRAARLNRAATRGKAP